MKAKTELQRLLSKRGIASRTKASILIKEGKVRVNGKILKDPTAYIAVDAELAIDGVLVDEGYVEPVLIAFHKPKGVVTTASDEKGRKTVYDVLPEKYKDLKAIGRLDMATSGLLLFTNDNQLLDSFLDPKNKIPRTYIVTVEGLFIEETAARLKKGFEDRGEILKAFDVTILKSSGRESRLSITLIQGKNREIRRMCKAVGHEVNKLKRISFGDIQLEDLPVGGVKQVAVPHALRK